MTRTIRRILAWPAAAFFLVLALLVAAACGDGDDDGHGMDGGMGGMMGQRQARDRSGSAWSIGPLSLSGHRLQPARSPSDSRALTLTLTPGEYELACTVVEVVDGQAIGQYTKGMHKPFTVTG
jgi:hypothetical protein